MSDLRLRSPIPRYALLALAIVAALLLFAPALGELYGIWNAQPEYSYGILIPALSAFLVWRERDRIRGLTFTGSWYGLPLIFLGLLLRLVGELSTMPTITHYAILLVLYGLILGLAGAAIFRQLLMPLLILVFMVPLPPFLSEQLSLQLQLLSSQIGVWVIRAAGISVFVEGNLIDLGNYQLQVAEACSGLRYLFPLMTLAFLIAYTFRGPLWKRAIVFISSIPITILMNSLRIGIIGITVDRWGSKMAEGLLHEFEGWVIFMISSILVLLTAVMLAKPWRRARASSALNTPATASAGVRGLAERAVAGRPAPLILQPLPSFQRVPASFVAATALVAVGVAVEFTIPQRPEVRPPRADFVEFPSHIGEWVGKRDSLQPLILDTLKLDDYLLADYRRADGALINFYVAYYGSQRGGMSIHTPRLCLPGGGWEIRSFERYFLHAKDGSSWPVNRVLIEQGNQRELVYYWFQERGRRLTSEYVVRWYLFWDSLRQNRTDGALVRLVVPIPTGETADSVDEKLTSFAALTRSPLKAYLPD
ncbi:MAG TPA: VPLPA-CTERM-specific exosortase XrtD [Steroidobacteraceae bacterium]|nr:VPLPA-CTERM-specific exosortase XrtD [Steroidobacteraceae bacterium]